MIWLKWLDLGLGLLITVAVVVAVYGSWRWADDTKILLSRFEAVRLTPKPAQFDARELEGLPAPVQRYFRVALQDGQPMIAALSVTHTGTFNMSETAEQWKPFTSKQRVIRRRPGFDWDARIMILPGVPVLIHDTYIAGSGLLHGAIFGLVPVVDIADTPELAQGELLRFFAEAAWYPTALLPSQGVRWEAVDDTSARATLTDGTLSVTLLFHFNQDGLIETARAEARGRGVTDGRMVFAPWQCRFWNYAVRYGMRIPLQGEVA